MSKETARDILLEAGRKTFLEKGFNGAGLEGILRTTGIPKGSFYYYFGSKEEFALEVLNRFDERKGKELDRILGDESHSPLNRLRRYFESLRDCLEARECREGCLVGNLSQEMADHSEAFRERLERIFEGWVDRLAVCLAQARELGEVEASVDVRDLAEFWLNSWQGAMLRAKTMRSSAPLETFLHVVFGSIGRPLA
ncbi:TetR family transcriptional regulator C-terminal domain-containing protein [Tundrisphaera sp. TA3]|uniref:TetR/AcrR family transcriptional regulator n=1 Tax=Tundrisphaera sp. TA3 TaxID=3435775 RepID=UPI003EB834FF